STLVNEFKSSPPAYEIELCKSCCISINVSFNKPLCSTNIFLPSTFLCSPFWNSDALPKYSLYIFPSNSTVSPGDSSCAANNEPTITIDAPKRIDLAISPCVLIPPSAIIGFLAALLQWFNAANCQPPVPNPVLIFVIQTRPGPIPTLV